MTRMLAVVLIAGCARAHEPGDGPIELDVSEMSECELAATEDAIEYWETSVGQPLFVVSDAGVRLPEYGYAECPFYLSYAHDLGHVLGLPDDQLERSLMNPGPWPNAYILPEHVKHVRELFK